MLTLFAKDRQREREMPLTWGYTLATGTDEMARSAGFEPATS